MRSSIFRNAAGLRVAVVMFVAVVLMAAAGITTYAQSNTDRLVLALGSEPATIDPHHATDSVSVMAIGHVYEGLVEFNENLEVTKVLAEDYWVSDDGLVWTFTIRPNVFFHDGEPLNAAAVKKTFDRLLNPDNGLARRSLFAPYIAEVQTVDEMTVAFHLFEPFGAFINHMSTRHGAVISPKAIDSGMDLNLNTAGTGPYRLKSWVAGDELVFERVDSYWGDPSPTREIVIKPVPEHNTRVVMLEKGEADVVYPIPANDVEWLQNARGVELVIKPINRVVYIGLTRNPIFEDKRVRQAFNYAVDQRAIADRILRGLGEPALSALGPHNFGYTPVGMYEYNPDKARELLREAGVNPSEHTVKLWSPNGRYLGDGQTAQVVQASLEQLGFNIDLRFWEWGAYLDEVDKGPDGDYEMFLLGWAPATGDADWGLRPLFEKGNIENVSLFHPDKLYEMLLAGVRESDPAKRQAIYAEAQQYIFDEAPWIFLYSLNTTVGIANGTQGVKVSGNENINLTSAWK